jgi:hypothetical protein
MKSWKFLLTDMEKSTSLILQIEPGYEDTVK